MNGATDSDITTIVTRLFAAILAGALIGLERTFHGRPAGFRTHALVCLASSALMLVAFYEERWIATLSPESLRLDPTRMAQGIMTGVGFIGAGVIFKEGPTVRGLTTAASIWMTSSIGILIGVGFYSSAAVSSAATLGILSGFRWIEMRLPREVFAHHSIRFKTDATMCEDALREMISGHGFTIASLSYGLMDEGRLFEYRMVLRTRDSTNLAHLAENLRALPGVVEFRVSPMGD
jgi:putative Mg2+ transporter-C (MgtC) family protein